MESCERGLQLSVGVSSSVQKTGRNAQEVGRVEQMIGGRSGNSPSEASTRADLEVGRSRTDRLVLNMLGNFQNRAGNKL